MSLQRPISRDREYRQQTYMSCGNQYSSVHVCLQEDGDDCTYEDLQPPPQPSPALRTSNSRLSGSSKQSYSWEILQVPNMQGMWECLPVCRDVRACKKETVVLEGEKKFAHD